MVLDVLSIFLGIALEVVLWHVGGPDFGWGAPWLLEVLSLWLLLSDLLGLDFLGNFDLLLVFFDLDGGLLVLSLGLSDVLFILDLCLGGGSGILDLLSLLLGLSLSLVDSILLLWVELWSSLSLLLNFFLSLLFWELFELGFLSGNGSSLLLLSLSGSLTSGISSLLSNLSGSLGGLEGSLSVISSLDLGDDILIRGNLGINSGSLSLSISWSLSRWSSLLSWSLLSLLLSSSSLYLSFNLLGSSLSSGLLLWSCSSFGIISGLNLLMRLLMMLLSLLMLFSLLQILHIDINRFHESLGLGLSDGHGVDLGV